MKTKRIASAMAVAAIAAGGSVAAVERHRVRQVGASRRRLPTVTLMVGGIDKQIYMEYQLAAGSRLLQEVRRQHEALDRAARAASAPRPRWSAVRSTWPARGTSTPPSSRSWASPSRTSSTWALPPASARCAPRKSAIHSWSQVKGKTLGVTDLGSGTDGLTKYLSVKHGVPVARDPPPGGRRRPDGRRRSAAGHGAVRDDHAADRRAARAQAHRVLDEQPRQRCRRRSKLLGGAYPAAGVLAKTSWVELEQVRRSRRSSTRLVATLQFMKTHSAAQIAAKMPAAFRYRGRHPRSIHRVTGGRQGPVRAQRPDDQHHGQRGGQNRPDGGRHHPEPARQRGQDVHQQLRPGR